MGIGVTDLRIQPWSSATYVRAVVVLTSASNSLASRRSEDAPPQWDGCRGAVRVAVAGSGEPADRLVGCSRDATCGKAHGGANASAKPCRASPRRAAFFGENRLF